MKKKLFKGFDEMEQILNGDIPINVNQLRWFANNHGEFSLEKLDTSELTEIAGVFQNKPTFDQDITGWDVGLVKDMYDTFCGAHEIIAEKGLPKWYLDYVDRKFVAQKNAEGSRKKAIYLTSTVTSCPELDPLLNVRDTVYNVDFVHEHLEKNNVLFDDALSKAKIFATKLGVPLIIDALVPDPRFNAFVREDFDKPKV